MPAPLANRISAIDAPVSSLRHSIFSEMPFNDFSRHGILSVSTSISCEIGHFLRQLGHGVLVIVRDWGQCLISSEPKPSTLSSMPFWRSAHQ